jgi:ABC-type dipeptide/oligopeptide/nickel transport system ATPase component
MKQLLSIRGLRTYFYTESGVAKAVDGVDLDIAQGEVLVSWANRVLARASPQLSILPAPEIPMSPGRIVVGRILYMGADLLKLSGDGDSARLRGATTSAWSFRSR